MDSPAIAATLRPPIALWRFPVRVALYARVSTLNGQHPEMQLAELREYATRRGWTVTGEYVDEGVVRCEGVAAGVEPSDGRCSPSAVRSPAGLED